MRAKINLRTLFRFLCLNAHAVVGNVLLFFFSLVLVFIGFSVPHSSMLEQIIRFINDLFNVSTRQKHCMLCNSTPWPFLAPCCKSSIDDVNISITLFISLMDSGTNEPSGAAAFGCTCKNGHTNIPESLLWVETSLTLSNLRGACDTEQRWQLSFDQSEASSVFRATCTTSYRWLGTAVVNWSKLYHMRGGKCCFLFFLY